MKKPDVLSEFKIKFQGREVIIQEETIRTTPLMLAGMVAQLDDTYEKMLAEHQQVVREIRGTLEKFDISPLVAEMMTIPRNEWVNFWDRFLKDKKSKGIG